jgi:hypothetical protein
VRRWQASDSPSQAYLKSELTAPLSTLLDAPDEKMWERVRQLFAKASSEAEKELLDRLKGESALSLCCLQQ